MTKAKVCILDYGSGNVRSVYNVFSHITGSIYDLGELAGFDIVFMMGVLMHIPPEGLETIRDEILKLNPKFIVHCENHSENPRPTAIYQDKPVQFSHDYGKLYKGHKTTITDKVRCPGGGANHLITIDL